MGSGTKIEITEAHYGGQAGSSSCTIVPEELQERFIPYHSTTGPCWNDVTAMVQTECTDSHLCEIDASSTLAAGESCANCTHMQIFPGTASRLINQTLKAMS